MTTHNSRTSIAVAVVCLGVASPWRAWAAQESRAIPAESTPSMPITVKRTESMRVVYVELLGPYWALGPHVRELQETMRELGQPGPMFVRYLGNPLTTSPEALRTRLSFAYDGTAPPSPPCKVEIQPSELVASTQVEMASSLPRNYETMKKWAVENGYDPTGPLIEVHRFVDSPTGNRALEKETQFVVVPLASRFDAKAPPRKDDASEYTSIIDARNSGDRKVQPVSAEPLVAMGESVQDPPDDSVTESSPALKRLDSPKGDSTAPSPSLRSSISPSLVDVDPPANHERDGVPSPSDLVEQTGNASPTRRFPVRELADRKQFDPLAQQLIPEAAAMPSGLSTWLGQVVLRIEALARGLERIYPGGASAVPELSKAVAQRFERVCVRFRTDARSQTVMRIDERLDSQAVEKRRIMRDLDLLLARVTQKSVDPAQIESDLIDILERIQHVMEHNRP